MIKSFICDKIEYNERVVALNVETQKISLYKFKCNSSGELVHLDVQIATFFEKCSFHEKWPSLTFSPLFYWN